MKELTRVQFPRFEYEDDRSKKFVERKLVRRASATQWLTAVGLERIFGDTASPRLMMSEPPVDLRALTKWLGVYHHARFREHAEQAIFSPVTRQLETYKAQTIGHDFLWDSQGMAGSATELVLYRYSDNLNDFVDEAALLIWPRTNFSPRPRTDQFYVIRNAAGEWVEPPFLDTHPAAEFYLDTLIDEVSASRATSAS